MNEPTPGQTVRKCVACETGEHQYCSIGTDLDKIHQCRCPLCHKAGLLKGIIESANDRMAEIGKHAAESLFPGQIVKLVEDSPFHSNLERAQAAITEECRTLEKMLLSKNNRYGNSVFEPLGIFSTLSPVERIKVRMDDKLKRLQHAHTIAEPDTEDVIADLAGYLILLRVARRLGLT